MDDGAPNTGGEGVTIGGCAEVRPTAGACGGRPTLGAGAGERCGVAGGFALALVEGLASGTLEGVGDV